jgi:hypothetical protein
MFSMRRLLDVISSKEVNVNGWSVTDAPLFNSSVRGQSI